MSGSAADPPRVLLEFLRLVAEGRYWDSHEVLEVPWRDNGSRFYQALILYASAWVHWERGNAHGVCAQLDKADRRLEGYPPHYLGLDVHRIRAHCSEVRRIVEAAPTEWPVLVAPLSLAIDPTAIRGDEPELR